ncbi:hypothetical protein [Mucilaginibacter ginsenosidivorax]|uniref:Uncharacterized protein n=1 Tax=Mucilaginibacter ginsenosidivorax TaxID=862126 RepID=A0A5B8W2P8_9SPHI|nr:hypothetical protein [Mucilaginibacter ginsenosidivorax]QEC77779.1 hypothetical protein FSB76_18200 [Mucilaginibacter ginsenosidivorax]
MKIFSNSKKFLASQIVSYITFGLALIGKNFSNIGSELAPFKYYIIASFFLAQAFMVYFIIQENKQKAIAKNRLKELNQS